LAETVAARSGGKAFPLIKNDTNFSAGLFGSETINNIQVIIMFYFIGIIASVIKRIWVAQ
jgi:hypothetical protein